MKAIGTGIATVTATVIVAVPGMVVIATGDATATAAPMDATAIATRKAVIVTRKVAVAIVTANMAAIGDRDGAAPPREAHARQPPRDSTTRSAA